MKNFAIQPVPTDLKQKLQNKIDTKTKPLGSLGELETIALKIGLIQNSLSPKLNKPTIVVFAADHGIAHEGVSAYPQEVTYQMVKNFLNGGAAINVFCRQNKIDIKIVDAGVNFNFLNEPTLINAKIANGTENFLYTKAMTNSQCEAAIEKGAHIVQKIATHKCNIIGFGEMGIGNTSSASVLMSQICRLPIEECVGYGTGLTDEQLKHKIEVLKQAILHHSVDPNSALDILSTFGGFEIAMMCGAILKAADLKMTIIIDGFIVTAAFLMAHKFNGNVMDYALFSHQSKEQPHAKVLKFLNAKPLLNLDMRLGEGTGAALVYPIIQSAVNFLNEMASFESAGVSSKDENKTRV